MSETKRKKTVAQLLKRSALLALLALPGISQAAGTYNGIFTLQPRTTAAGKQFYLATVPSSYYTHCPAGYNNLPYLMIAPGGYGNFTTDPTGHDNYYTNITNTAYALRGKCIRVISIEAPNYSVFDYPETSALQLPADTVNTDYWANLPPRRAAAYLRDTIINIQADAAYKFAPRWFLRGGSASSMYAAKLIDVYGTAAAAGAAGFKYPKTLILESLPSSGNVYNACRYSTPNSLVRSIADTLYQYPFGYPGVTACQNIIANPNSHNWKFYNGLGLATYTGLGNNLFIMNGADDSIYKDNPSIVGDSWTMDKLLSDFVVNTGKCSGQAFSGSNSIAAVNRDVFFDCDMKTHVGLYRNGGHGPVSVSSLALDDLVNTAIDPGEVRGIIDPLSGNTINGWACAYTSRTSISVHLYLGGSAGVGTMVGAYDSNKPSEAAVGTACSGRGTAYRFSIPLTLAMRQAYQGKKIYIHAIQPMGTSPNWLVGNSGVYSVPVP